jgi:hypothetical protein
VTRTPSRGGNQGCSAAATVVTGRAHSGRYAGDVRSRQLGLQTPLSSAAHRSFGHGLARPRRSFGARILGHDQLLRVYPSRYERLPGGMCGGVRLAGSVISSLTSSPRRYGRSACGDAESSRHVSGSLLVVLVAGDLGVNQGRRRVRRKARAVILNRVKVGQGRPNPIRAFKGRSI